MPVLSIIINEERSEFYSTERRFLTFSRSLSRKIFLGSSSVDTVSLTQFSCLQACAWAFRGIHIDLGCELNKKVIAFVKSDGNKLQRQCTKQNEFGA